MKLILHIGPHKTGSSSIQASLKNSQDYLAENRILFFGPQHMIWSLAALYTEFWNRENPFLKQKFASDDELMKWSAAHWSEFERLVATSDAEIAIISSEQFSTLPPDGIARMMERLIGMFDDIKVVVYARDPASLYLSSLQEGIKSGWRLRDAPLPDEYEYRLRGQIERYVTHVAAENIIVRSFDRQNLKDGDVVKDFCGVVSAEGPEIDIPSMSRNESIPGAALAWFLSANELSPYLPRTEDHNLVVRIMMQSPEIGTLPKMKFGTNAIAEAIRHRFAEDSAWINERFLRGQVPLPLGQAMSHDTTSREALRDWIMSYMTVDAMKLITEQVTAGEGIPGPGTRSARMARRARAAARA
ncbi:hypothetical protein [Oceanicella sp. SM1341]|uniref:hypothetical protein n=1 Tax=Oceanicella sp. SM1341 TaxID=1548889 RepID=UPI0013004252|nr:hypothetical protein [Oceanicella sp. SM1341]